MNSKVNTHIGEKIKELRKSKEISQENLAQCLGLCRVSLVNIESGRQGLTLEKLLMLCAIFNCTFSEILPPIPKVQVFEKVKKRQVIVKRTIHKKAKFTF